MTPEIVKDLWMLQWTLNTFLEAGSNQVRKNDIHIWLDPNSDKLFESLRDWEKKGFIVIEKDPRHCKEKEVCLKILKPIEAIEQPKDLSEGI